MSKAYEHGKAIGHSGWHVGTAASWTEWLRLNQGTGDYATDSADWDRGIADGYAQYKAEHPYSVYEFGSHPDEDNDDCYAGEDFATIEEARAAYLATPNDRGVAYIMLDGPDVNEIRKNPSYRKPRRGNDEWQSEFAMQAGMAFGCQGYNDAMGY